MNNHIIRDNESKYIHYYIKTIEEKNGVFKKFINMSSEFGQLNLIGGSVRDILLRGKHPRDLDFVLDISIDDEISYEDFLKGNFKYTKNRFGGYKIDLLNLEIDIWSINNHWAFKNNKLSKSMDNLQLSTFFDFDSLSYNLSSNKIQCELFNKVFHNKTIDITLNEQHIMSNPSHDINIIRLCTIKNEWGLNFSKLVEDYISYNLNSWHINSLLEHLVKAQQKHYKNKGLLNKYMIRKFINRYVENKKIRE